MRHIGVDNVVEFMSFSSYAGTESTGAVKVGSFVKGRYWFFSELAL